MTEAALIRQIQVAATKGGCRLFRNNCGQLQDRNGQWVRYGVANPGGSDLIGWTAVVVNADMIGKKVALFTAIEVKSGRSRTSKEQTNFIERVQSSGGIASIVRTEEEALEALQSLRK